MLIITVILGLIVGVVFGRRIAEYLLITFYHSRLRNGDRFYELYVSIDDEFHFEMYSGTTDKPPKKYADYLKLHQDMRSNAHSIYMSYLDKAQRYLITLIAALIIAPSLALLFIGGWYLYLITVCLVIAGYVTYLRLVKDNGLEFHGILMTSIVLNHLK